VDVVIQSTDKNFMVPVGGAVICGPDKNLIDSIAANYPGKCNKFCTLDSYNLLQRKSLSDANDGHFYYFAIFWTSGI
jgi:hypothetical protein